MAQTERDWSSIESLLADQISGAISPQDVRDGLASGMGYGSIVLSAAGGPVTMSSVGTTYELVDVFDTITGQSSTENAAGTVATLASTHRLTMGATGLYYVNYWASFSAAQVSKLVTFRLHLNGSVSTVLCDRDISTGGDVGSRRYKTLN